MAERERIGNFKNNGASNLDISLATGTDDFILGVGNVALAADQRRFSWPVRITLWDGCPSLSVQLSQMLNDDLLFLFARGFESLVPDPYAHVPVFLVMVRHFDV